MEIMLTVNEADISFEILFHQNPHPMWIVDIETLHFLLVNDAAIKHYGYSYKEFMTITLADIRLKEEHKRMKSLIRRIKHNQTIKDELQHVKKDGSLIYVQITSYSVIYHHRECRMVLINDVTERRLKDLKIKDAWDRIYQTLESITDGFISISKNWKITYWNKEAEKIFGISKDKALNKAFWKLCNYGKEHELFKRLTRAMETRERESFEIYMDHYLKWLSITIYPGRSGLTMYFQDITGQKYHGEQMELKNKHLDEIAYINSHLLRKPIANIMGIVNSLDDELTGNYELADQLQMLKSSAHELDKMIKVINSRVEQGTMPHNNTISD